MLLARRAEKQTGYSLQCKQITNRPNNKKHAGCLTVHLDYASKVKASPQDVMANPKGQSQRKKRRQPPKLYR